MNDIQEKHQWGHSEYSAKCISTFLL